MSFCVKTIKNNDKRLGIKNFLRLHLTRTRVTYFICEGEITSNTGSLLGQKATKGEADWQCTPAKSTFRMWTQSGALKSYKMYFYPFLKVTLGHCTF